MTKSSNKIIIYTDGSSLGNPGPGGFAAVISDGEKYTEIAGGFEHTTNNRMEMLAAIEALQYIKTDKIREVDLHTDSRLLVDTMTKGWIENWKRKNWRKSNNDPVLNIDLWERLLKECERFKVNFKWVPGHSGVLENERCDVLSKQAADSPNKSVDYGYTGQKPIKKTEPNEDLFASNNINSDSSLNILENNAWIVGINQKQSGFVLTVTDKHLPSRKIEFPVDDPEFFMESLNEYFKQK